MSSFYKPANYCPVMALILKTIERTYIPIDWCEEMRPLKYISILKHSIEQMTCDTAVNMRLQSILKD